MIDEAQTSYEFDNFRLIPAERQLLRDGRPVSLPPKAFDTLVILVRHSGHALQKDQLIKQVWPDSFVEESNLNHYISLLRKTLNGKNGDGYVETIRGYGFRFNAGVRTHVGGNTSTVAQRRSRTHVVIREEVEEQQRTHVVGVIDSRRRSRPAVALLVLLGLSISMFAVWGVFFRGADSRKDTASAPVISSIAVLPFTNVQPTDDTYLNLGMADALITKLGRIPDLGVRPTSAIQKYAEVNRDPLAIGRELKVDAVIDGRIHRSADSLRITVQLLRMTDGSTIWTEDFDGPVSEIFNIQDSLSKKVAQAIAPNLTEAQIARLGKPGTDNAEAYQYYLKGRDLWRKRTTESFSESVEYFQRAISKDPKFALAYDGLADVYLMHDAVKAESTLRKALELDDTLGEAHASLGFLRMFWHWDWAATEDEFKRAIELEPGYATAHQWYALYLSARGNHDEAKTEMSKAIELDPRSPNLFADRAQIYYFAGEYDEAISQCQEALKLDPEFAFAHDYLVAIYAKKGMFAEAVEQHLKSNAEHSAETNNSLRQAFVTSGWKGFLQKVMQSEAGSTTPTRRAWIHAYLGDTASALRELEKAYDARDFFLTFVRVEPAFEELRAHPRFQHVLQLMNLN